MTNPSLTPLEELREWRISGAKFVWNKGPSIVGPHIDPDEQIVVVEKCVLDEALLEIEKRDAVIPQWNPGAPPKPFCNEWFIAETTFGDRVVLKALPEEFTYDFKTGDETYIMKDKIKRWMQFPDSDYIPYRPESKLLDEALLEIEKRDKEIQTYRRELQDARRFQIGDREILDKSLTRLRTELEETRSLLDEARTMAELVAQKPAMCYVGKSNYGDDIYEKVISNSPEARLARAFLAKLDGGK